ncbi:hypothetical protein CXB51_034141 [Gossypium anomalum]|uniref:GAG-pre-integrase domain-containing protein n=1 Tax=Gossypium anomalum TaxID=47600 RepID=A0A8J6CKN1_9ROSI|nr:hypothetical protein CXB51_034141 [Gossypium anomalum]
MQTVLAQMDLEDALLGLDKMPATLMDKKKRRKDEKDLTQLHLHLSNEILQNVLKEKPERAFVHEHLTVFKKILSDLEVIEVKYDKEDLGLILFGSLPPYYSTFRDTILYSLESLTVDEVYASLISYDKMKHFVVGFDSQEEGLINKIKSEDANKKGKQPELFSEVDVVEEYSDSKLLVVSTNNSKVNEEWIFDSGCIFHMSPNQDWFTTYETMFEGVNFMRNNASCKIVGIYTIKIKMFDGVVRTLTSIRHVPELKRNLISLSTFDLKGHKYTTKSGVLKISKVSLIVMKGQRKTAKLYVLQGSTVIGDVVVAFSSLSNNDVTKLWHMRLGHMSENNMIELCKIRHLDGQGISKLNFCKHRIFGKQKRVRFTRGIHNTKGTLDYNHFDLWGPSRVPSRGDANYMLTIIDNFQEKFRHSS